MHKWRQAYKQLSQGDQREFPEYLQNVFHSPRTEPLRPRTGYQEYREHDAILHVLCRKRGIVHVNARGIQKVKSKNAPACQLFTHVRMQLPLQETRSIYTLRSAEIIEGYRHIREDLLKQSIAAYVCECIDASKFEEDVFEVVQTVLDILQETTHPIRILCLFQAIMNRMHGIEPYVDGCVRCGNQKAIYAILCGKT